MATITSKVYVHGGDYDCSEAVRMCYRAIDILPYGSYMWTGNELALLKEHGFVEVKLTLSDLKRGDVLWKEGHTEMYLGNGLQGGARIDEVGGIHGPKKGDQTGREIASSAFDQAYWKWQKALRYFGSVTSNGIPAGEAAAQVMEHLIEHAAHGYSQNNRAGDGTVEKITLSWNKTEVVPVPTPKPVDTKLDIDGWLGKKSIIAWQKQLAKYADGVISGQAKSLCSYYPNLLAVEYDGGGGSLTVIAVQRKLGITADGVIGPATVRAIQRKLGVYPTDGILGFNTAKAIQQSINSGAWR